MDCENDAMKSLYSSMRITAYTAWRHLYMYIMTPHSVIQYHQFVFISCTYTAQIEDF